MSKYLKIEANDEASQTMASDLVSTDQSVDATGQQVCMATDVAVADDTSVAHEALLADVVERARGGDCGAPFAQDVLTALVHLRDADYAEFVRVRAELKEANKKIPLAHLDRQIRQQAKAAKAVYPTHHGYAKDALNRLAEDGHQPVSVGGCLFVPDSETALWADRPTGELERLIAERHDGGENCFRHDDYHSIATHAVSMVADDTFFQKAPEGVACRDSFYTVRDDRVHTEPLKLEHRQTEALDYEPIDQPTPLFNALLKDTFKSAVEGEEEEQMRLLQETAGAMFLGIAPRYHKAVCWLDRYGRAGKGTMQAIFQKLLPISQVAAVSPVFWNKEYYLASLEGKRLNVVGEMPDDVPIPAPEFKAFLGGDQVTGRNPAGRPIMFRNKALHVFMSNHLIATRDHTAAFYDRWLFIGFLNSRLKNGLPLDPQLAQRIISQEMAGIAYWALQGAKRLLEQGRYSPSSVHDRLMKEWRRSASSIDEFVHECCATGTALKVRRTVLYGAYQDWCRDSGRKPFAKGKFADMLSHNLTLGVRQSVLDGIDIWRGIGLKSATSPAVNIGPDTLIDF